MSMRNIGILGGTFDPVHLAHLMIAEHARSELSLDAVWLMPTGKSPHKDETGLTPIADRLAMLNAAVADNPQLSVSTFEIDEPEVSYTYRTAERLAKAYPSERFYYILGADSLKNFGIWRHPEIISRHFHLLAAVRDGEDREALEALADDYLERFGTRITVLDVPNFSLSSTDIRSRIAAGRSIRYLTTDPVISYITEHQLYDVGRKSTMRHHSIEETHDGKIRTNQKKG